MNEKTAELRDIFTEVADGDPTVTESQQNDRGSLASDDRSIATRLEAVVEQMRDRYEFPTPLSTDDLVTVARGFYDDRSDEAIAADLETDAETVFEARMALHLFADEDAADVDLAAIRDGSADEAALAGAAATLERYRRVAAAQDESRAANDRYRDEFDSLLADADLTGQLTTDVTEDGLEDATEGMETSVDF